MHVQQEELSVFPSSDSACPLDSLRVADHSVATLIGIFATIFIDLQNVGFFLPTPVCYGMALGFHLSFMFSTSSYLITYLIICIWHQAYGCSIGRAYLGVQSEAAKSEE